MMGKISFNIRKDYCDECSMALRRFRGHVKGVESIEVDEGKITVVFDGSKIDEKDLFSLTRDSIEKLGYELLG